MEIFTSEDTSAVSYKTKCIYDPANIDPRYLSKISVQNMCTQKLLSAFYTGFIYNSQSLKSSKISFCKCMDKLIYP
jgi:hypothetical protein